MHVHIYHIVYMHVIIVVLGSSMTKQMNLILDCVHMYPQSSSLCTVPYTSPMIILKTSHYDEWKMGTLPIACCIAHSCTTNLVKRPSMLLGMNQNCQYLILAISSHHRWIIQEMTSIPYKTKLHSVPTRFS